MMSVAAVAAMALDIPDEQHERDYGTDDLNILPTISTNHNGQAESSKASRCLNGNGFTVEVKLSNGNIRYMPDRCDRWDCPYCSMIKARKIAGRLHQTLANVSYYLVKELVLSIAAANMTIEQADKAITGAWNKLRLALQRENGKFPYFWVKDYTRAGYIHLHILLVTSAHIDREFLKKHYTLGEPTVALAGNNKSELKRKINYIIKRMREARM